MPTTVSQYTQQQFTQRILNLLPSDWTGDSAKQPGGGLYSILSAAGNHEVFIQSILQYAFNACRIQTATDTELDLASQDFFGTSLPRNTGESDSSYRQRILSNLLLEKVTKQSVANAIFNATGTEPRIIEPWCPNDTGSFDNLSFFDVDTAQNPGLWGDESLNNQVFIQAALPYQTTSSGGFVGFDTNQGFDSGNSFWFDAPETIFVSDNFLDDLINNYVAAGITVWRKYFLNTFPNVPFYQAIPIASGLSSITLNINNYTMPYAIICNPNWQCKYQILKNGYQSFTVTFDVASPSGAYLYYYIAPITSNNAFIVNPYSESTINNFNTTGQEYIDSPPVPENFMYYHLFASIISNPTDSLTPSDQSNVNSNPVYISPGTLINNIDEFLQNYTIGYISQNRFYGDREYDLIYLDPQVASVFLCDSPSYITAGPTMPNSTILVMPFWETLISIENKNGLAYIYFENPPSGTSQINIAILN